MLYNFYESGVVCSHKLILVTYLPFLLKYFLPGALHLLWGCLLEFKFKFMCIECRSVDKLSDYLTPKGYKLVDKLSHWDYVFALEQD